MTTKSDGKSPRRWHRAPEAVSRWLEFLRLGIRRNRSHNDYRAMQSYIARATIAELAARGVDLDQSQVLELGAGTGGYSTVLDQVSMSLISSDLYQHTPPDQRRGASRATTRTGATPTVPFTRFDASRPFPFQAKSFDWVFCSSLIEHIAKPAAMLSECWRVLRPRGILFLSFPPFCSLALVGGHSFKPFHLLGERLAVSLINLLRGTNIRDYATAYGTYGLYPLKIDQVRGLILDAEFEIIDVYTRMSTINTARLPGILKDLATWHVCYLARKATIG